MRVKDGGAMMSVDQAVDAGAELSKAIMELILLILAQIREKRGGDETRSELLRELDAMRDRLEMLVFMSETECGVRDISERVLTPAEKIYGIKESREQRRGVMKEHSPSKYPSLDM